METTAQDAAASQQASPVLELITKETCHLCEDAREVVATLAESLGLAWTERQIDGDEDLTARYGEEIPVVLVDGIQRDFWHIDKARLEGILRRAMAEG